MDCIQPFGCGLSLHECGERTNIFITRLASKLSTSSGGSNSLYYFSSLVFIVCFSVSFHPALSGYIKPLASVEAQVGMHCFDISSLIIHLKVHMYNRLKYYDFV